MMATVSISKEYEYWDNTEAVDVILHKDGRELPSIPVANALRLKRRNPFQTVAGIVLSSNELGWWLPIDQLGSSVDIEDVDVVIQDADGNRWRVRPEAAQRVILGSSASHWEVASVKELART